MKNLLEELKKLGFDGNGTNTQDSTITKLRLEVILNIKIDDFESVQNEFGGFDYTVCYVLIELDCNDCIHDVVYNDCDESHIQEEYELYINLKDFLKYVGWLSPNVEHMEVGITEAVYNLQGNLYNFFKGIEYWVTKDTKKEVIDELEPYLTIANKNR